jgi:cell division septum initiation protein DivIVA
MAMSFSRPDPSSPTAVSTASFTTSRKGFEQGEVRDFLRMVAAELARLQEREKFLERELRAAQRGTTNANVALDEEVVTRLLGEEAARILSTAREAASQIKVRAEENASRVLREATDEAQRLREEAEIESSRRRQDAAADAESELQMAKQQGRDMVNEARAYRERVLGELARRREMARQQIEQLVHGRDRLLQAFERARIAAVDVMAEMTPLGEGANEYVNLSPTTGPVPLMVPAEELRRAAREEQAAAEEPAVDEIVADVEAETELEVEDEPVAADVEEEVADESDDVVEAAELYDVELEEPDTDDAVDAADTALTVDETDTDVVALDIQPADDTEADTDTDDDGTIAPVVSLFGGDTAPVAEPAVEAAPSKGTVDDLFAKLRASRTDAVAERTRQSEADVEPETEAELEPELEPEPAVVDATEELSVFQASPVAPATEVAYDDTPFGRRDAELTPLIVAAARKLKRVLADEQNEVLHSLRSAKSVRELSDLLPAESEHVQHYAGAIHDELVAAAVAGAASVDDGTVKDHTKAVTKGNALDPAVKALTTSIVQPLRDRLERAVADADGDAADLTAIIRSVYREWKNQRIDEHLDDIAQLAFGRGALVALAPGTPVCWSVDPNGPDCPDAEDNALAGVVKAGDPFPTDHVCAPAHEGCRCMLQRAPL